MTLSPFPPRCIKLRLLQCTRRGCANLLLPFAVNTLSSHVWGKYRIPRPQLDKNSCITKIHSYLLHLQFSGLPYHHPWGDDRVNFRVHIQHVSTILLLSFFLLLPWSLFHIERVFPFPIFIFVFCFISMFLFRFLLSLPFFLVFSHFLVSFHFCSHSFSSISDSMSSYKTQPEAPFLLEVTATIKTVRSMKISEEWVRYWWQSSCNRVEYLSLIHIWRCRRS